MIEFLGKTNCSFLFLFSKTKRKYTPLKERNKPNPASQVSIFYLKKKITPLREKDKPNPASQVSIFRSKKNYTLKKDG